MDVGNESLMDPKIFMNVLLMQSAVRMDDLCVALTYFSSQPWYYDFHLSST